MAIRTAARARLNAVEIIGHTDDALDEGSDYGAYVAGNDPTKLKFKPGMTPTRFLCNFEFSGKEAEVVKNAIIGGKDDDGTPKVALGSWSFRVAKMALKDIVYAADVELNDQLRMRKDDRQLAHDDLVADLDRFGVVQDIFSFYTAHVLTPARSAGKNS